MYTDPESGISVGSNGSRAAESFMAGFMKIVRDSNDLKEYQKSIIYKKYGHVYFVTPDGWVEKCKQKGDDSFMGIMGHDRHKLPCSGEFVCVGCLGIEHDQKFVIYKIIKVELRNRFFDLPPMIYGEELEVFNVPSR